MSTIESIVVIGAGLAAAKAIDSLREEGFAGSITLIGDEAEPPYERPALSKDYLQGNAESDSLFVHDAGWYGEHQVTTHFGDAAVSIDRANHQVALASGATVPYDRLLLVTGSRPRELSLPGANLGGIFSLRRLSDSDAIRAAFATAHRVVVIGAGWIGLEAAAAAKAAGLDVTVLEYAPLPLQRALGDELAGHFAQLHRAHGVDLRTSVAVTEITGVDGRVTGVRVGAEQIDADMVVIGVGVAPNVELASAAGLDVDNGITVDEHLQTSDPSVFAAGDVANAVNTKLGQRLRVEHWDNAIRQGRLAGRTILGKEGSYDWQPYFYTDQFDLGMEYVGLGGPDDDVIFRGDRATGEFIAFWLAGNVVRAGMNVNVWDVNDALRGLIGRTVDRGRLADPEVPLTEVSQ